MPNDRARRRRASARGRCPGRASLSVVAACLAIVLSLALASLLLGATMERSISVRDPHESLAGVPLLPASERLPPGPGSSLPRGGSGAGDEIDIVPASSTIGTTCANGTTAKPYVAADLPYGDISPDLFGIAGQNDAGYDQICMDGTAGPVDNMDDFTSFASLGGQIGWADIYYGWSLYGSATPMAPQMSFPWTEQNASKAGLWLTMGYSIDDWGQATEDFPWDNFLTSYKPTSAGGGPQNATLEVMLYLNKEYEGRYPTQGQVMLPTLENSTFGMQPWGYHVGCPKDWDLGVEFYYNGSGALNATSRVIAVNFSYILPLMNQLIKTQAADCWTYPADNDSAMYLDALSVGMEYFPSYSGPYYSTSMLNFQVPSMCFRLHGGADVASVTCNGAPSATITASPEQGFAPLPVAFTSTVSGGMGPDRYLWDFGDGSSPSLAADPDHQYNATGTFPVSLSVTDATGSTTTSWTNITVSTAPLVLTATCNATAGQAPMMVAFGAKGSGGSPPYSFSWHFGDGTTSDLENATHTYASPGNYVATVWLNDTDGRSGVKSWDLVVAPASGRVAVTLHGNVTSMTLGASAAFSATAAGGTPPYVYAWTLPPGCSGADSDTIPCQPSSTGTFTVTVAVTDLAGRTGSASTSLQVVPPPPTSLTVALTASPDSLAVGSTSTLQASVSGGSGPYTYAWTGLPSACPATDAAELTCAPTAAGHFNVSVAVQDPAGGAGGATTELDVYAPSGSSGSSGAGTSGGLLAPGSTLLWLLAGAAALAVAGVGVAVWVRRKPPAAPPSEVLAPPNPFGVEGDPPPGPPPPPPAA